MQFIVPWEIKRETLVKAEEETNPNHGSIPSERVVQDYIRLGIINVNKPSGPSSHEVTAWVKNILCLDRAGHGGTLER